MQITLRPAEEAQITFLIIIGVFYLIHYIDAPSYRKWFYAAAWLICLFSVPDFPIKLFNFLVHTILEVMARK